VLIDSHAALLCARNPDELLKLVMKPAAELGFGLASMFLAIDQVDKPTEFFGVANYPEEYEPIASEPGSGKFDPVMQHLKTSHRPIAWDRQTYLRHGREHLWEVQAPFGFKTGISAALHLSGGEHFSFGVDRAEPLPEDEVALTNLIARVHLLTVYTYEAGARLLRPAPASSSAKTLAQRERDCLLWTAEGKTAWEIGRILSLSERTVAGLLSSATRKLECVNKQQAVVKALRLGLLDLH
jgi:DNA-binding CsgD family transcriptional regulator